MQHSKLMGPPLRRYNQVLVCWIKLGVKEYIPITDGWISQALARHIVRRPIRLVPKK